jgi:hypothetical protein
MFASGDNGSVFINEAHAESATGSYNITSINTFSSAFRITLQGLNDATHFNVFKKSSNALVNSVPVSIDSALNSMPAVYADIADLEVIVYSDSAGTNTIAEFTLNSSNQLVLKVAANEAPVAIIGSIIGITQVGQFLTGNYQYLDLENDLEGTSTFKWYRSSNADGTGLEVITGAESKTYTLTTADQDKYIYFEVTPIASTGTLQGVAVLSPATSRVEAVKVLEVTTLDNINVANRTQLSAVNLPGMISISLSDGSNPTVAVSWDGGTPAYDGNQPGIYVFTGTISIPEGVINPENLKATVNVVVANNVAPVAKDVTITGIARVGDNLTGSYSYSDLESDPEGTSTFKWYRSSNADGTGLEVITGAEGKTYKLRTADQDKYIYFEVMPVASTGTLVGTAKHSSASNKVEAIKVTDIPSISDINVKFGTQLLSDQLPSTVAVQLNNGNSIDASIIWDGGTPAYDANISGTYVFKGSINLPEGVSNPDNLKATVNVVIAKNTDATAKEIKINNTLLNGFSPSIESYSIELPYGTTAIPEATATANDMLANVLVTPATVLPGTTNVVITAEDGVTIKNYTIMFTIAKNTDATLSTLSLSQGALNPVFSPTTTSYTANVNYGVTARSINLTLNDDHASVTVNGVPVSITTPIYVNLSEGTNNIKVEVTAEDGVTIQTYSISITELEQTVAEAVDQVNAAASVSLMQTAITNIRLGLILNGYNSLSENDKSAALWSMLNGRPYTDKAAIQNALDTEVCLIEDQNAVNAIKAGLEIGYADGDSAGFVTQDLMLTTNQDGVSITWVSDNVAIAADGIVTRPKYSSGDVTVTLTTTLTRGSSHDTKTFTVKVIKQAANTDATLKQININGVALSGFESVNKSYSIELPNGTSAIPEVTATANDSNAKIVVTPTTVLPGTTEVGITAEDGLASNTYSINFTIAAPKNTDATLSDLKVDGTTIADFAPSTLDYNIMLPTGTTVVPTVTAVANDTGKANILVTPATNLPGSATVLVTAEDGLTAKTYTINFTVVQSVTVTTNQPDVAVTSNPLQIFILSDVNNASLTTTPVNGQVTLPQVDVQSETSLGTVKMLIPSGNLVTGSSNWKGTINLPQVKENNSVTIPAKEGITASASAVIELGFSDTALTFSQPVRIALSGLGGKKAGWIRNSIFTPITFQMATDSADALGSNTDGFITVDNDLVIWTKHFTIFVAYTEAAMEQTVAPIITGTPTTTDTSISGIATPGASIVLSINGTVQPTVTADAITGSWTVTGLALALNDIISVTAQVAGKTVSTPANATVTQLDECFIATAAFGSKFEPAVVVLRHFRDQFLLTSKLGTAFVNFYYHNSPPIAAYIAHSEPLKALVRIMLIPVIAATYSIMNPGVGIGGIILLVVILAARKSREKALTV